MNPLIRATPVGEARPIDTGSRGSQLPSNALINLIHLFLSPSVVDVASARSAVSAKDTPTANGRRPTSVGGLLEVCYNHVLSVSDATQARPNAPHPKGSFLQYNSESVIICVCNKVCCKIKVIKFSTRHCFDF